MHGQAEAVYHEQLESPGNCIVLLVEDLVMPTKGAGTPYMWW